MKKNEIVRLKIEDITEDGLGLGRSDSMAVFVKDTVIGDEIDAKIVKVKKSYAYGRVERIITQSSHRVTPVCPDASRCGGCQLQAMSYEMQMQYKENRVRNSLERIGGFKDLRILPIDGAEDLWHYRNKAQYPVGIGKNGGIVCGFYAARTHSIINRRNCTLQSPENEEVLETILEHMRVHQIRPYDENTGTGLVRHILIRNAANTGQRMVCLILNGRSIPGLKELAQKLMKMRGMTGVSVNVNTEQTNVILGKETYTVAGKGYLEETIGDMRYRISPTSFFQVNSTQMLKLYRHVLDYAAPKGSETVLDLYCGAGTISLFLARKAGRVIGVEVVEDAVKDAHVNASLNGIQNASFFAGKAEELLPREIGRELPHPDVIVVDPPRKGCDRKVLDTILETEPERIVYVSCDPATLARDLKYLCETRYEIQSVQPVDMFPMTCHVETVVLLTRNT